MAVAIKAHGFHNIKIFNGGLGDWKRAGMPIESIEPLPEYTGPTISPPDLYRLIRKAEANGCRNKDGSPMLTLIDFRASCLISKKIGGDHYKIKTSCPVIVRQLDDFMDKRVRLHVPRSGTVVCISETGKRNIYLQRYLHKYGFNNIISLESGMRGWLKNAYPAERLKCQDK